MEENIILSSLSETVKQLLLDGVEVRKLQDDYKISLMYNKGFSYIVAELKTPYTDAASLLKQLQHGNDCVTSLRFY